MVATTSVSDGGSSLDLKAAVLAGLIAGAVFLVLEMLMVQVFLGMSMWGPPRMIAAIAMGNEVLPPPATFDAVIVLTAMLVHFILSVLFALVLAWLIRRMSRGTAVLAGSAFGLALYLVNFYGMTALFPWFAMARNWVSVVAHIVFGATAAWAYVKLRTPVIAIPGTSSPGAGPV